MKHGGPAFPCKADIHSYPGMYLRDWFAGQALIGWLSGPLSHNETDDYDDEPVAFLEHQAAVATTCYAYADAMLKAREA